MPMPLEGFKDPAGKTYTGFIYRWLDSSNGKMYIGSHIGNVCDRYKGSGHMFKYAYKKRPECFTRTILEYCLVQSSKELRHKFEQKWLDSIPLNEWETLYYNMNRNASGYPNDKKFFVERAKVKRVYVGKCGDKNPMFGYVWSEEQRLNVSMKLKKRSERVGYQPNPKKACKGKKNGQYGKPMTAENRRKHSELMTGRYVGEDNPRAKVIDIFNANGQLVKRCKGNYFSSCKEIGIPECTLRNTLYRGTKIKRVCNPNNKKFIGWYARYATN